MDGHGLEHAGLGCKVLRSAVNPRSSFSMMSVSLALADGFSIALDDPLRFLVLLSAPLFSAFFLGEWGTMMVCSS